MSRLLDTIYNLEDELILTDNIRDRNRILRALEILYKKVNRCNYEKKFIIVKSTLNLKR